MFKIIAVFHVKHCRQDNTWNGVLEMTTEMLFVVCTMLNASNVVNGYDATKLITYSNYVTHGTITCIDIWQLSDRLKDGAHPESLSYKRGEELHELGIYGWYIPTETLMNDYTDESCLLDYDLANYVITDHWKIEREYKIAKALDYVTC